MALLGRAHTAFFDGRLPRKNDSAGSDVRWGYGVTQITFTETNS